VDAEIAAKQVRLQAARSDSVLVQGREMNDFLGLAGKSGGNRLESQGS